MGVIMNSMPGHSFTMLGMNLGANFGDYSLLHEKPHLQDDETLESLLQQYNAADPNQMAYYDDKTGNWMSDEKQLKLPNQNQNPSRALKGVLEEKIFFLLENERKINLNNSQDSKALKETIANLLFDKGLDILESRFEQPFFKDLITSTSFWSNLKSSLENKLKDDYGAKQFKESYPQLSEFIQKKLKEAEPIEQRVDSFFSNWFSNINSQDNLQSSVHPNNKKFSFFEQKLQSIKDRLSRNFFNKVINSPDKPAVITMQEVYQSNSAVLDVLREDKYTIIQANDTAIAIDSNRFEKPQKYELAHETIGVYAKEKKSREEYLFVSVHIPGYNLEYPENSESEEKKILL